jgi:hypothetical protein
VRRQTDHIEDRKSLSHGCERVGQMRAVNCLRSCAAASEWRTRMRCMQ